MPQDDAELERIRQKRLAEMQQQNAQRQAYEEQAAYNQQRQEFDAQKAYLMQQILSSEARSRLTNIRMARPEFAEQIEMQLIQIFQSGSLRGKIPLSDETFKNILIQLQQQAQKREPKIRF